MWYNRPGPIILVKSYPLVSITLVPQLILIVVQPVVDGGRQVLGHLYAGLVVAGPVISRQNGHQAGAHTNAICSLSLSVVIDNDHRSDLTTRRRHWRL